MTEHRAGLVEAARNRWPVVAACVVATLAAVGCAGGGKSDVPVGDAAENIRKLALAYVEYAAAHGGVGPANEEQLAKSLADAAGISPAEAKSRFTSIRDNKPYIIRWKMRTMAPRTGPDAPKPNLLIYESEGLNGTRYTADGRLSIKEMTDEQIKQTYPDFEPPAA